MTLLMVMQNFTPASAFFHNQIFWNVDINDANMILERTINILVEIAGECGNYSYRNRIKCTSLKGINQERSKQYCYNLNYYYDIRGEWRLKQY